MTGIRRTALLAFTMLSGLSGCATQQPMFPQQQGMMGGDYPQQPYSQQSNPANAACARVEQQVQNVQAILAQPITQQEQFALASTVQKMGQKQLSAACARTAFDMALYMRRTNEMAQVCQYASKQQLDKLGSTLLEIREQAFGQPLLQKCRSELNRAAPQIFNMR